jgi:hypothetical protein
MASSKYSVLFLNLEASSDNHAEKKGIHTVPAKGFFRFGETAGTENLLIIFKELIPELEKAIAEAAIGKSLNLADTDSLSRDSTRPNLPPGTWSSMMRRRKPRSRPRPVPSASLSPPTASWSTNRMASCDRHFSLLRIPLPSHLPPWLIASVFCPPLSRRNHLAALSHEI